MQSSILGRDQTLARFTAFLVVGSDEVTSCSFDLSGLHVSLRLQFYRINICFDLEFNFSLLYHWIIWNIYFPCFIFLISFTIDITYKTKEKCKSDIL